MLAIAKFLFVIHVQSRSLVEIKKVRWSTTLSLNRSFCDRLRCPSWFVFISTHRGYAFKLRCALPSASTFNPLMPTLKPQSNGPLCSNTVIRTLAVDGCAVTVGTARRGRGLRPRQSPLRCTKQQPTHQRPAYQLHIIRRGTITNSAL